MEPARRFPKIVEWMPLQGRSSIDVEGVAPRPGQKARLDRLDKSHGGLAGYRTGWGGGRCCHAAVQMGAEGWSDSPAPYTVRSENHIRTNRLRARAPDHARRS